ncbi:MAG: hypothetical protein ASARMPRED_009044 [Alectoria sarmentosa]|nr:MAG: hypothetical protein ASARMPRED_009044 [Alectoria sarmentosa]
MRALPTQELTPQLKLNLLNIHVEIRNEIYRMVLTTQYAFHPDRNGFGRVKTALLCVNRKIHTEATDVLQGPNVWIVARINMSEQARFNFIQFLWHVLDENGPSGQGTYTSLWLGLGASPFCTRTKLQSICLEPFGLVRNLSSIVIDGDVQSTTRQQLLNRMESPFVTVESVFEIGREYIQRGDNAHAYGDHMEAHLIFIAGQEFLCHAGNSLWQYMRTERLPRDGVGEALDAFLNVLESRGARPMLHLGRFEDVKELATRMLAEGDISDVDRMNLTLCKKRAQRALDEDHNDHNLAELVSIPLENPHAFVEEYFEAFPSATNSLEAKWVKVVADLGAAKQRSLQRADDELRLAIEQVLTDAASYCMALAQFSFSLA